MKNSLILYLSITLFIISALQACDKPSPTPPGPVTEDTTDTSYPFETSRIDAAFLECIDTLDIIGDREISSVESDADWISTIARGDGRLRLEIEQNETAEHRTDTLHVNFDDGGSFDLVVSQNAYPMIYVTCTKSMLEIWKEANEYGEADIPLEIELGEDTADFGLGFAANIATVWSNPGRICESLARDDDNIIHLEDYMYQIENHGEFTVPLTIQPWADGSMYLAVIFIGIDEHGNYPVKKFEFLTIVDVVG